MQYAGHTHTHDLGLDVHAAKMKWTKQLADPTVRKDQVAGNDPHGNYTGLVPCHKLVCFFLLSIMCGQLVNVQLSSIVKSKNRNSNRGSQHQSQTQG